MALASDMALSTTTLAAWLVLTRSDGIVLRATNHDQDLTIDGNVYYSRAGGTVSDVQSSSSLNVDNSELNGVYSLDYISERDLRSGLYDGATYSRGLVNWADTTRGVYRQSDGKIGQVKVDRSKFIIDLFGLMTYIQQSFGRVYTVNCSHRLGDSSTCKVDLGAAADSPTGFTRAGRLTGVSQDQLTMYDTSRTEPGPSGGISITAITNANPCVITTATALGLPVNSVVTLSAIDGPSALNGVVQIRNPSGTSFSIDIDTTDTAVYPAYVGSGIATPEGADSGYFDYGMQTMTEGENAGISRAIKSYVPGQWTLRGKFPFPVYGDESYEIQAGCDHTAATCRVKFANLDNHGGFPYVAGNDHRMQVGRQS